MQGPIDVGNKIDRLLPRIVEVEGRFNFSPCDAAEQRRQDELTLSVIDSFSPRLSTELLSASLNASKGNWDPLLMALDGVLRKSLCF